MAETASHGYSFDISGRPDFSLLTVDLPARHTLKVETGAMAAQDSHIRMTTSSRGGFQRLLSRESIFINEFSADDRSGKVSIAPGIPGDIAHVYLQDQPIYLQNAAFLASAAGVEIQSKWQGFVRGFFSGEGLFLIRCSGVGDLWFNSFGGILPLDVKDELIVDTGYLVAFTDGLTYDLQTLPGMKSFLFSGEGFVARLQGEGTAWIQTRQVPSFTLWLDAFRRQRKSKSSGDGGGD